jgi:hypothetical protein
LGAQMRPFSFCEDQMANHTKKAARFVVLEKLEKKHRGDLRVDDVIKEAKDPKSALHDYFEWDLGKAAHSHWRETAKQLIKEYRFVITKHAIIRYAPIWVSKADAKTPTYVRLDAVKRNKARSLELLQDEIARIVSACDRSMAIASHFDLEEKFEEMLKLAAEIKGFLIELI